MKRLALLLLLLAAAAGCGNEQSSYASILIYQGQEYIGKETVRHDEYGEVEPVGAVTEQVEAGRMPAADLSSNELAEGTEICLLDENTLLAKLNDREYNVFERKNARKPGSA
jgi:hypothetical protein